MLKLLVLSCLNSFSFSFLIDYSLTKMITINDTSSYFGYSILLQKGQQSFAIVGAPKRKRLNQTTGTLFRCDLKTLNCNEVNIIPKFGDYRPWNKNSDFLGANIVGDDIVGGKLFTCAPRYIMATRGDYYLNGRCFYFENMLSPTSVRPLLPLQSEKPVSLDIQQHVAYFDAAFGEAGFDMAYLKNKNALLLGAPGKSLWKGSLIKTSLTLQRNDIISLPNLQFENQNNYHGYSVAWGKFVKGTDRIWYVSGGPRGNRLKGSVNFFDQDGVLRPEMLTGPEIGSYFGASLLVMSKPGGGDDLLVGAPMYSGDSYDEGCVYYYTYYDVESVLFNPPLKLSPKKSFSRFGTVMAAIGDIDLDSYSDCAISAPYEDDGVGAVYIYFGTQFGFSEDKFYRISPSHFSFQYPGANVRGFGLGLSNGKDINNIKHNNIAIGAYQSAQIFYFTANELFDVSVNFTSNTNILYTSSTNFSITFCISFKYRNGNQEKSLNFLTSVTLGDDRILNAKKLITKTFEILPGALRCFPEIIFLNEEHLSIDPIIIPYGYKTGLTLNTMSKLTESALSIPMSYECGTDDLCQTNLTIKATTEPEKLIFGVNKEVKVNVTVSNSGESAYQTRLQLIVPPEISLINLRECDFTNGSYICLVARTLNKKIEKSFLLDLTNLSPSQKYAEINFAVTSIGEDVDPSDNELRIKIPVIFENSPYINNRSLPESVILNKSKDIKIVHSFLVANLGPSPLDLNFTLFVPQNVNGSNFLEIKSAEVTLNDMTKACSFVKENIWNLTNSVKLRKEVDTKIVGCGNTSDNCTAIACTEGYLPKSNKNAVFTLKLIVRADAAVNLTENADKLLLISTAYYNNGTMDFFSTASTLIFKLPEYSGSPLWVYVASAVVGLSLLFVLIFSLYKCNFFKRRYKELLENEESGENTGQCEGILEDEDFL